MRLRVLGCSGGIGGRHLRTTSYLLDSDILIDAGTVCRAGIGVMLRAPRVMVWPSSICW